jgi:hypothetical protein
VARLGRPERPLDPAAPFASFAAALRDVRSATGVTYRQLSLDTGISPSRLSAAANGRTIPSLDETMAFVAGCGVPVEERQAWFRRWRAAVDQQGVHVRTREARRVDPRRVSTHEEFVAALRTLLRLSELSYGQVVSASDGQLSKSTVSDMLTGRSVPTWDTTSAFLATCGDWGVPLEEWFRAWQRVRGGRARPPAVLRRRLTTVADCDPHEIGVHRALTPTGSALTTYVGRDVDPALNAAVTAARRNGGLLVLVGPTGAGKTRAAYEALLRTVPDFAVVRAVCGADPMGAIPSRAVVWCDDLAQLLTDKRATRALGTILKGPDPAIMVGALWPDQYQRYLVLPRPGAADTHALQRQLLAHASVVDVPRELSARERANAKLAAECDPAVAAALASTDGGPFQIIAGARHLVSRWRNAADPYGQALISAAVEARRCGVSTALKPERLRAAARRYLTPAQQAQAPPGWFESGLAYATATLPGGVAAVIPVAWRLETGEPYGYVAADYLVSHGGSLP